MTTKVLFFDSSASPRGLVAASGQIELRDDDFLLPEYLREPILYDQIDGIELSRLDGLGTYIRVRHDQKVLGLLVPRLNIGGRFVIVNMAATQRLFKRLSG